MKIQRLDLKAYGPFTDFSVDLSSDDYGFHVLYGPNEAGKSSMLRALTSFFYGIAPRTLDAYLHPMTQLRIGALLSHHDGREQYFQRRKGNKNTLLDVHDLPLEESVLTDFLGGTTEQQFSAMFGLTHESLVKGGADILSGGGDIGESLFEAGTGILGLRHLIDELNKDAEDLFKARGSISRLNRAIAAHKEAKHRMNSVAISGSDWKEHEKTLEEAQLQRDGLEKTLRGKQAERHRLERIRRTLALHGQRRQLLKELQQLGDVIILPDDARDERLRTTHALDTARRDQAAAAGDMVTLQKQLDGLSIPEALLAQQEAIKALALRVGAYSEAILDLPGVKAELEEKQREAREYLRQVYPDLDVTDIASLRLSKVERNRIKKLAEERPIVLADMHRLRKEVEDANFLLAQRQAELAQLLPPPDVSSFRAIVSRVVKQGDINAILREHKMREAETTEKANTGLQRLGLWSGTLEALELLPIPLSETIDQFDETRQNLDNRLQLIEAQIQEYQRKSDEAARQIEALRNTRNVPTENDLAEARGRRGRGWSVLRDALVRGGKVAEEDWRAFAGEEPVPLAYEKAVDQADDIADRLRREAHDVASLVNLEDQKDDLVKTLERHIHDQQQLSAEKEKLEKEWRKIWQVAGIEPLSPREMRAWLGRYQEVMQLAAGCREHQRQIALLEEQVRQYVGEIGRALHDVNGSKIAPTENLAGLLDRAESVIASVNEIQGQYAELSKKIADLEAEKNRKLRELTQLEQKSRTWEQEWNETLKPLRLPSVTTPDEAMIVIETLDIVARKGEEAGKLHTRINGMEGRSDAFRQDAGVLIELLVPELVGRPPDFFILELNTQLDRAVKDKAIRDQLLQRVNEKHEQMKAAQRAIEEQESRLVVLLRQANCASLEALVEAEQKSREKCILQDRLADIEQQLLTQGDGASLEILEKEVEEVNADALPGRVAALAEEIEIMEQERSRLDQVIGEERNILRQMDGTSVAATAAEDAEETLSEIRTLTRRYMQMRLAGILLHRAIENYREQHQGPLLGRAGELFQALTLGSFKGLKTAYDDNDKPVLVGVRPSGGEVTVEGMSEGTRDQLYLALRLASIERHITINKPVPIVLDDILINFDDDRSRASLSILSDLSRKTQVLFFTHHARLVELSRETVPKECLMVHRVGE